MPQLLIKGEQLGLLFAQCILFLLQLFTMRSRGRLLGIVREMLNASRKLALQWNDVFRTHTRQRPFVIAMEIDKTLECPLLATGEQAVDRSALVGLQVIFEETLRKITTDRDAWLLTSISSEALCNEG